MANKMTKVQALAIALSLVETSTVENREEVATVISGIIEQTNKKNSYKSNTESKENVQNTALCEDIVNILDNSDKPMTCAEVRKTLVDNDNENFKNLKTGEYYSVQKVSAMMRKLDNRVVKEYVKGTAMFTLA